MKSGGKAAKASCFDRAAAHLARRPWFVAELAARLARDAYAPEEIVAAMNRLTELGYLDDRRAVAAEVERLGARRGYGPARLRADLARRGAPTELVEEALRPRGGEAELESARAAAAAWRRRGGRDAAALARHLARRGFATRAVLAAVRELGDDEFSLGADD